MDEAEDDRLPDLVLPVEARDHTVGPVSARSSLVEYGDYTSEECRHVLESVNELTRELGDELCFAFRPYPVSPRQPIARRAAEAAEAAGLQGKFWLMHERLFARQDDLTDATIRTLAQSLPVELSHFERDLASGEAARRVDENLETGREAGVEDTPCFFVNGRLHVGSYEFVPLLRALEATGRDPSERP